MLSKTWTWSCCRLNHGIPSQQVLWHPSNVRHYFHLATGLFQSRETERGRTPSSGESKSGRWVLLRFECEEEESKNAAGEIRGQRFCTSEQRRGRGVLRTHSGPEPNKHRMGRTLQRSFYISASPAVDDYHVRHRTKLRFWKPPCLSKGGSPRKTVWPSRLGKESRQGRRSQEDHLLVIMERDRSCPARRYRAQTTTSCVPNSNKTRGKRSSSCRRQDRLT